MSDDHEANASDPADPVDEAVSAPADPVDEDATPRPVEHAVADPAAETTQLDQPAEPTAPSKKRHKAPWWELPALVALAIVIAILVKTFLIQPFYIPSESMEKTLHGSAQYGHDRILVNKLIYDFRDPHPGDIVVFDAPPGWNEIHSSPPSNPIVHGVRWFGQLVGVVPPDSEVLVKRVIAIGGQTVWGDQQGVHVRTKAGKEHLLNETRYIYNSGPDPLRDFGPVTVPKGRLWVMGDHRNDSQDSRYHCSPDGSPNGSNAKQCDTYAKQATVPVGDVIGKAFVVAWPPSDWRTLGTPSTFNGLAAALDPAIPSGVGVLTVLPLWVARRRRRRR